MGQRSRLKPSSRYSAKPRLISLPPKIKKKFCQRNWRRPKSPRIKRSKIGMKWEWQRLRKLLRLRSRRCVSTTTSKCVTRPSTKLGLRSPLPLVESVYYSPAIHASDSLGFKANTASKEADVGKESPTKALPLVKSPSKEAELPKVGEKPAKVTKEVAYDAN